MQAANIKCKISADAIKNEIASKMDAACFSSWINPLSFAIENGVLVLSAPNQFTADFVSATYLNVINSVAANYSLSVFVRVGSTKPVDVRGANDNNVQTYSAPQTNIVEKSGFDSFISCEENAFVLSACKKMASGAVSFSPLFIYGPAGCGKSMLAGCVAAVSNGKTVTMSAAQFVSEFARALHDRTIFAFKDYCRNCDTFILDDVQVLAGKRATCEEFLQLIIDLRNAGKNIILVADAAPSNLTGFDHRAQSLFASGLVADVVAPTRAVRREMFVRAGVKSEVADMLAGRVLANGHIVSGVLNKVRAYSDLMNESIDMATAERLLGDTLKKSKSPVVMVRAMCEKLGVSYDAVCGNGRNRALVLARQMMMYVLKMASGLSLSEIGQYVGDRDHATVMYAISRIEKMKDSDLIMNAQLIELIDEYK